MCIDLRLAGKRYYGTIDRIPQSRHNSSDQGDRAFGWIKFVEAGKEEIHFRFDRILFTGCAGGDLAQIFLQAIRHVLIKTWDYQNPWSHFNNF